MKPLNVSSFVYHRLQTPITFCQRVWVFSGGCGLQDVNQCHKKCLKSWKNESPFLRWQPVQCFSCNNWQSPTSAHFCTGKHLQGCPRQRGVWKGAKSNSDCVFFSVVPGRFLNTYRVYGLQSMLSQDAYVCVYVNIYIRYTSYLHVYQ